MPEFDRFIITKDIPWKPTHRFITAYVELNEEVYIVCRAQRRTAHNSDDWVDLPNRILFPLELAPDLIEGMMEASVFDPTTMPFSPETLIEDGELIEDMRDDD